MPAGSAGGDEASLQEAGRAALQRSAGCTELRVLRPQCCSRQGLGAGRPELVGAASPGQGLGCKGPSNPTVL